jgi:hypothetical protein
MQQFQCGTCGGVIADPSKVSFQLPNPANTPARSREGPCRCAVPVVYGPPAGFASIPSMPSAKRPPADPSGDASRGSKRPR